MKLAITSVYANPLHPGHVECFEMSKQLADELWVVVNNDAQAKLKRGTESFQDEVFRTRLVSSIKGVDRVVLSIDTDRTVCQTLKSLFEEIKTRPEITEVIFTKGGDRFADEIPEKKVCDEYNVAIVDSLGDKIYSSSSYVNREANTNDTEKLKQELKEIPKEMQEQEYIEIGYRPWGVYYILENNPHFKVKKIIMKEGQSFSLQSHNHRSEHWVVVEGMATVQIRRAEDPTYIGHQILRPNESCHIPKGYVHQLANNEESPLVLIEVQTGEHLGDDDIIKHENVMEKTTDIDRHLNNESSRTSL